MAPSAEERLQHFYTTRLYRYLDNVDDIVDRLVEFLSSDVILHNDTHHGERYNRETPQDSALPISMPFTTHDAQLPPPLALPVSMPLSTHDAQLPSPLASLVSMASSTCDAQLPPFLVSPVPFPRSTSSAQMSTIFASRQDDLLGSFEQYIDRRLAEHEKTIMDKIQSVTEVIAKRHDAILQLITN